MNLSSRPFYNHRLLWITVVSIFFISLWFILWAAAEKNRAVAMADEVEMRINSQQQAVESMKLEQEKRKLEAQRIVISEQDAVQLAAARQLIATRAFSWNKLLADIEVYVPKDARITNVKVSEVADAGQEITAAVEIKALGKGAAQMTEMMNSLERSGGLFVLGQVSQSDADDSGEVPFTINTTYRPFRGAAQ